MYTVPLSCKRRDYVVRMFLCENMLFIKHATVTKRIQWRPLWDQAKQWLLGLKIICRGRLRQLPQGQAQTYALRTNLAALGLWIFQGAKPLTHYRYFTVRMLLSELLDNLRLLDYITAAALHFNVQKVGTTRILGPWHPCAIYKHHWVRLCSGSNGSSAVLSECHRRLSEVVNISRCACHPISNTGC